ncbi:MAG: flagellar basal body-associated FliL family protein [Gammaproteobacteria bacterium]
MAERYQRQEMPPAKEPSFLGKAAFLLVAVLSGLSMGIAAHYYLEKQRTEKMIEEIKNPPNVKELTYFELSPPIIANFSENSELGLVQVSIVLVSEDSRTLDALKKHEPKIRNNLLLMIGAQPPAELKEAEGKEKLRASILQEVRRILNTLNEGAEIKEVLFTSFVMQ